MPNFKKLIRQSFFPILAGALLTVGIIYAWSEPITAPPGGNVPAPINTGATTQTKQGGDICVNIGGVTKCLSTGGGDLSNVRVGPPGCNNILTFSPTCNTEVCDVVIGTGQCTACGRVATGGNGVFRTCGGSCSAGSSMSCSTASVGASFLSGANHSTDSCTVAGGEVMQDGSDKYCKFSASSCPSGWTQFKNWSATTAKTCTGTTNNNTNCPVSSCSASGHTFTNTVPESCSYKSSSWTPQTCYYDCGSYHCLCPLGCMVYGDQYGGGWYDWYWDPNCCGCSWGYDICSYDCPYCADSSSTCFADIAAVGCY